MPKGSELNEQHFCETPVEFENALSTLAPASLVELQYNDGGVMKTSAKRLGILNHGTGDLAETASPHYNLVTHAGYFRAFKRALDSLNIPHTATVSQYGNAAFVDFDFKGRNIELKEVGEEFTSGIRLGHRYDKTTGITIAARFVRLACSNGMVVKGNSLKFVLTHHDKMARETSVWLETRLNEIVSLNQDLQMWVSQCMQDSIEWHTAARIMERLINNNKHLEHILEKLNIDITWQKKNEQFKKRPVYLTEGDQNRKLSRWDLYNAITAYATHGAQITPFIEQAMQTKAQRILKTKLEKMPMAEVFSE